MVRKAKILIVWDVSVEPPVNVGDLILTSPADGISEVEDLKKLLKDTINIPALRKLHSDISEYELGISTDGDYVLFEPLTQEIVVEMLSPEKR